LAVLRKLDAVRKLVLASQHCSTELREGVSVEREMPRDEQEEHHHGRPDVGLEAIVLHIAPDLRGDVVRRSYLGLS